MNLDYICAQDILDNGPAPGSSSETTEVDGVVDVHFR